MVRNAIRFRHSDIRLRRSVTTLRHERPRREVVGVASAAAIASVAAHIAPAVAEARAAPAAAIASVAAHTVAAIAGDSDEGVDRVRAPQFPLHPYSPRQFPLPPYSTRHPCERSFEIRDCQLTTASMRSMSTRGITSPSAHRRSTSARTRLAFAGFWRSVFTAPTVIV
jgi:hypothetical protein